MEMVRATRQQGVPVIKVDDEYIVGFDQQRLERAIAGRAGPSAKRPVFGASIADVSAAPTSATALPPFGAYVGAVRVGSAAERAGLTVGDVIVELNGEPVQTAAEVQARLAHATPGASIRVGYLRRGERRAAVAQL